MADVLFPPLEVCALDEMMNRCTGVIPYRSLRWVRRYYESGEFEMVVPADIYDPSWAYIYTDDRPETGIIQKVEFNDDSQVYGGIDSITVSGFFFESVLNNITFLVEQPEEIKVAIPKPKRPYVLKSQSPKVYTDTAGGYYYTNSSGDMVDAETGDIVTGDGLVELDYKPIFGMGDDWDPDTSHSNFDYTVDGDKSHITVVDYNGDINDYPTGPTGTYEVEFITDKGDTFYYNRYGNLTMAFGVANKVGNTYFAQVRAWEAGPKYKIVHVKGPWQRTDTMDPITEGDSIDIVFKWVQDMCGNNMLYEEPEIEGITKKVDPSFQRLGDLVYSTLREVGASFRVTYSFQQDVLVFSVYRGLDRSQNKGAEPGSRLPAGYTEYAYLQSVGTGKFTASGDVQPVASAKSMVAAARSVGTRSGLPDGYAKLEYIQSTGAEYINTGFVPDSGSRLVTEVEVMNSTWPSCAFGTRQQNGATDCFSLWLYDSSQVRYDYDGSIEHVNMSPVGRYVIDANGTQASIGSAIVTADPATFSSQYPLTLFGQNQSGGVDERRMVAKMYSCSIYDNGALVRNYVPCRQESNGAIGLFDLVESTFYANNGDGSFIAGPDVIEPEPGPEPEPEPDDSVPWAVFSDTWGTLTGYSAYRDTSNYRNKCFVLYDYDRPAEFDETGWPVAGPIHGVGDLLALPRQYGIQYESKRGYHTNRLDDGDYTDREAYLDLREEKPSCDNMWSRERVELPGTAGTEQQEAIAEAEAQFARPEGNTVDMRAIYEAWEEDISQNRGPEYLKQNYPIETNLDTGTVNTRGYMTDWDLGDNVDYEVSTVGLKNTGRIVSVEEVYEADSAQIRVEMGDPVTSRIKRVRIV